MPSFISGLSVVILPITAIKLQLVVNAAIPNAVIFAYRGSAVQMP